MARIRTIKPEFFTSPDTAGVSHSARLLYIAMWSWADDYGRGEMNLLQLRAFAFPEEDQWLENELQSVGKEFQSLCKEVVNGFGLTVYKHRGRSFYDIPSWDDHQKTQRRAKSKYPAPDDPECTPDLRFHESEGTSETMQGSSESMQGKGTTGTGEQGNRGRADAGVGSPAPTPEAPQSSPSQAPSLNSLDDLADGYAAEQGDSIPYGTPEDPRCYAHRNDLKSDVPPCFKCKQARDMWAERDSDAKQSRRQAIDDCTLCDDSGWLPDTNPAQRCNHTGLPQAATGSF